MEGFVQVGEVGFKDKMTGEWTYGFPLYAKTEDVGEGAEDGMIRDIGRVMERMMQEYVKKCAEAGIPL